MSLQVGQMEEVLIKPCRHQFHHPRPLAHRRHQIAFPAHGRIELNVVPVFVLILKEPGIEKYVRPCRLHPKRVLRAGELLHHHLCDLGQVRKLPELQLARAVIRRKNIHPVNRLQAKMTKHACKIDPSGIPDPGPLITSYCFVKMGRPEAKSSFFRNTIQILKILSRWHIRTPGLGSSSNMRIHTLLIFGLESLIARRIHLSTFTLVVQTASLRVWSSYLGVLISISRARQNGIFGNWALPEKPLDEVADKLASQAHSRALLNDLVMTHDEAMRKYAFQVQPKCNSYPAASLLSSPCYCGFYHL